MYICWKQRHRKPDLQGEHICYPISAQTFHNLLFLIYQSEESLMYWETSYKAWRCIKKSRQFFSLALHLRDLSFTISRDLKDSSVARNSSSGQWTCFILRLRFTPVAHGCTYQTHNRAGTMSCCHYIRKVSCRQSVLTTLLSHRPWCHSPWHEAMPCCPSDALGRWVRLVLVLWQCCHIHAGNHSAHGRAIHVFLMCQNSWLYCRACYKGKRRCDLKTDLKYWAIKDKASCCRSWINLPKRMCWIFQCGCDVAAVTSRFLLRSGNPKGFLQQNLSWTSY